MRIWFRNFFIAFAISLALFAIPAYFLVNYTIGQMDTYENQDLFTTVPGNQTAPPTTVPVTSGAQATAGT